MSLGIPVAWLIIFAGYLTAGIWLGLIKRWPLRAGLIMAFFCLLPDVRRDYYFVHGAGDLGYMLVNAVMLPLPAILIIGSLLMAWIRWAFGTSKKPE